MSRLWTSVRKELIHISRDTRTLALIIILPALLLVLLGYGVSGEQKNIPMVVADLSKTDFSRRYIDYYTSSNDFEVAYDALNEAQILEMIDKDMAQVGLLIPEDFGREISTGGKAAVHGDVRKIVNTKGYENPHGHEGIKKPEIQGTDPKFHDLTLQLDDSGHSTAETGFSQQVLYLQQVQFHKNPVAFIFKLLRFFVERFG